MIPNDIQTNKPNAVVDDSTTGGSLEEESTKNKLADYMERILKDKETTQSIRRSRRTEKKELSIYLNCIYYYWTICLYYCALYINFK